MTFDQFVELVDKAFMSHQAARSNQAQRISASNQWRYGQTLMNVLWQTHRNKYEDILGTEYDCFYTNSVVPKTLKKLKEEWDVN